VPSYSSGASKGYGGPGLGNTNAGKVYSPYDSGQGGSWGGGGSIPTSMGSES
jgi:hypothetical protein